MFRHSSAANRKKEGGESRRRRSACHVAAGRWCRVVEVAKMKQQREKIERSSAAVLRFSRRGEEIVDDTARRLTGLPYCLYVAMPRPPVVFDDGALSISIDGGKISVDGGKISVDGPRDGGAQ